MMISLGFLRDESKGMKRLSISASNDSQTAMGETAPFLLPATSMRAQTSGEVLIVLLRVLLVVVVVTEGVQSHDRHVE